MCQLCNTNLLVAADFDNPQLDGWMDGPTSRPLIHPVLEAPALFLCLFGVVFGVGIGIAGPVNEIPDGRHVSVDAAVL